MSDDDALKLFALGLLSGASPKALAAEFGPGPGEDETLDLARLEPGFDFSSIVGRKVHPTDAIRKYLATGDALTHGAINSMELAMEAAFSITHPFFIASMRDGKQGRDLRIRYFYLDREA